MPRENGIRLYEMDRALNRDSPEASWKWVLVGVPNFLDARVAR
jgi:hypothetical protein